MGGCLFWSCWFSFFLFFLTESALYTTKKYYNMMWRKCILLIISSITEIVAFNNLRRKYWLIVHVIHNSTGTRPCSFKENKLGKQTAREVSDKKKVLSILGHKFWRDTKKRKTRYFVLHVAYHKAYTFINSKEIEKKSFSCSAQLDCGSRPLTLSEKHLSGNTVIENTYENMQIEPQQQVSWGIWSLRV